jgi:predicted permease
MGSSDLAGLIAELSAVVLPVLIVAGIGFAWVRFGRRFDGAFLTDLVSNVGAPCLVAHSLISLDVAPATMMRMGMAVVVCLALFGALGLATLRIYRLSPNSFLPALMFPNTGNMGLPLSLFAFGSEGLALAVVYFACTATLQFTLGISLAAGSLSLHRVVRTPAIYAVVASVAVLIAGVEVPRWIDNTMGILGGLTIPLMLLTLGVSLAQLRVSAMGRNAVLALVRMLGGFVVSLAVADIFDLPKVAAGVLIIQSTMPVAVFNFLFAKQYGRAFSDVAAMVVISTIFSFVTLPFLVFYVLR